jgi:pSer/pThr/pTyr-binding forkhead associated (FHA) protein
VIPVKDLKRMKAALGKEGFEKQLGPFVLLERPPNTQTQQKAMKLGAKRTMLMKKPSTDPVDMLLELDDLLVATLPPLDSGEMELVVGRSPDADVVIDDPSVSKHHAKLIWDGTRTLVEDLKSSNGTWVNNDRLHVGLALNDLDTIRFGEAQFCYVITQTLFTRLT